MECMKKIEMTAANHLVEWKTIDDKWNSPCNAGETIDNSKKKKGTVYRRLSKTNRNK